MTIAKVKVEFFISGSYITDLDELVALENESKKPGETKETRKTCLSWHGYKNWRKALQELRIEKQKRVVAELDKSVAIEKAAQ